MKTMFRLLLLLCMYTPMAHAQLDPQRPGQYVVIQDGEVVLEVYVEGGQDPSHYREYWFAEEKYTFIDARLRNSFQLVADGSPSMDLESWKRAMFAAHPEGRLLIADCDEAPIGR